MNQITNGKLVGGFAIFNAFMCALGLFGIAGCITETENGFMAEYIKLCYLFLGMLIISGLNLLVSLILVSIIQDQN